MTSTIDTKTKVNLGILGALIVTTTTGAFFLSNLNTSVHAMDDSLKEVKQALDRNTAQLNSDGKAVVVLQTLVQSLERRVLELERGK